MFKVVDADSTVYVELSINGQTRVSEFPPGDERAFVVGSSDRASLRIGGDGIAPVQFHLEREDGSIWLIPAYGIDELRVDGFRVLAPTPLGVTSVIEFCNVRIHAAIIEAARAASNPKRLAAPKLEAPMSRRAYARNLPGEDETTPVAMPSIRSGEPTAAQIHGAVAHTVRPDAPSERVVPGPVRNFHLETPARDTGTSAKRPSRPPGSGSRTKGHILLVIGGATVGVLVLALAFLVVVQLVERHRRTTTSGTPTTVDTKFR